MFGELIGLALAQAWLDQGAPARFTLAELGPGRGTFMADALRATRAVPGFHQAARLYLVEASPTLRARQQQALADHAPCWVDGPDALPDDAPLFLVANEFFDALPIRQFLRDGDGWRERQIGRDGDGFSFGLGLATRFAALDHRLDDTRDGDLVETCAEAAAIARIVGERIAARGGAALIIDYGDWRSRGDTFQALENHAYADPFAHPGRADLTAHVDFEALVRAAPGLTASALTPQGALLAALGIEARATKLAQSLTGAALDQHVAGFHRLTGAEEMGTLFKALALVAPGAPLPPGFAPAEATP
jgi:SAM-dependent MidA family methyltransferase